MPRLAPFGYSRHFLVLTVPFTGFLDGTSAYKVMTSKAIPYACELERVEIVTNVVGTGSGATKVLSVRKGSDTGTAVATVNPTLANQGTLGVVTAGTVTTAAKVNNFIAGDTLSVTVDTAGAVAFTAGGFDMILTFRDKNQSPV